MVFKQILAFLCFNLMLPIAALPAGLWRDELRARKDGSRLDVRVQAAPKPDHFYSYVEQRNMPINGMWQYKLYQRGEKPTAQARVIWYQKDGKQTAEIDELKVLQAERGAGVGSLLFSRVLDDIRGERTVQDVRKVVLMACPIIDERDPVLQESSQDVYAKRAQLLPALEKFYERHGGIVDYYRFDDHEDEPVLVQYPTSALFDFSAAVCGAQPIGGQAYQLVK